MPRFGDPGGISTLSQVCRGIDQSRVVLSATVRMSDRAEDDRGGRGPAASAARIVRLAASQGFYHGETTEGHGGPQESERSGRSRLRHVAVGQVPGHDQPLRLLWPSVALRRFSVLKNLLDRGGTSPVIIARFRSAAGSPDDPTTPQKCGKSGSVSIREHLESLDSTSKSLSGGAASQGPAMWRAEHRGRDDRGALRCPGDLSDAEWALIGPVDPLCGATPPAKRGGNQRAVDPRGRWGGAAGGVAWAAGAAAGCGGAGGAVGSDRAGVDAGSVGTYEPAADRGAGDGAGVAGRGVLKGGGWGERVVAWVLGSISGGKGTGAFRLEAWKS